VTSLTTVASLARQICPTPVTTVTVAYHGITHRILLKRECYLPTGSIKYRTAIGLLAGMDAERPLHPGTVIVESTSGGLGAALAHLLAPIGCQFIAVIDPKTPAAIRQRLVAAGAQLHCVTDSDGHGGYLYSRLRLVRELCQENPHYRWTNQYDNPANSRIHQDTTGPEITQQAGPGLDGVYAAVSTGGTLAGIAAHIRPLGRPVRIVAVDSQGSYATTPQPGAWRNIPGIGASRPSTLLRPGSYDRAVHVRDADAIAVCQIFHADTGVRLGGSSGHVLHACLADLAGPLPPARPLCLCADDGDRYTDTIYDPGWIAEVGLAAGVRASLGRLRGSGLSFAIDVR
jgi:cysteine synthase